jgi:dTDP-glucose 4,6-dehydratase
LTYAGTSTNLAALISDGRVLFVRANITEFDTASSLLADEGIDTVVNFAAETHVDRSIQDPSIFVVSNVLGTQVLLEAARKLWGTAAAERGYRFHQVSTDEVFGSLGPDDPPFTERSLYAPNSPYAATKAGADHLVRAYAHTYGLPVTISHCSNNYGPYQFPEKLLPLSIVNVLTGRAMPIYGDGLQVRDWLYVHDHCRAIDLILHDSPSGATWNIGGDCQQSNLAMITLLCDIIDAAFAADDRLKKRFPQCPAANGEPCATLITHVRDRLGHDRRYATDCRELKRLLGFECTTGLRQGLTQTIEWYIRNEVWWRSSDKQDPLSTAELDSRPLAC